MGLLNIHSLSWTHEQAWTSLLEDKRHVEESPVVLAKAIADQPVACWLEMQMEPSQDQPSETRRLTQLTCRPRSNKSAYCFQHSIWGQVIMQRKLIESFVLLKLAPLVFLLFFYQKISIIQLS